MCSELKKLLFIFLRFHLFLEREEGREGEKHQCVVASHEPPTGDLVCNPGICPDWELNRRSFGSQASTQSTEPRLPGLAEETFKRARGLEMLGESLGVNFGSMDPLS